MEFLRSLLRSRFARAQGDLAKRRLFSQAITEAEGELSLFKIFFNQTRGPTFNGFLIQRVDFVFHLRQQFSKSPVVDVNGLFHGLWCFVIERWIKGRADGFAICATV